MVNKKIVCCLIILNFIRRTFMAYQAGGEFPTTLAGFGYAFNEDGKLRKIDEITGKPGDQNFDFNVSKDASYNQQHYEALGEVITKEVYNLLEKNGLYKIFIPSNIPKGEATFIFSTKQELVDVDKLLIIIHGSGVVRAGQWSRSLIINHSLESGSHIPYIDRARKLGYDVIVTNTNDNFRIMNGKRKSIVGSESPSAHAVSVWKEFVTKSTPNAVAIVAHSYGGVVTMDLAQKYRDFFREKVFAIGLTDSVHYGLNDNIQSIVKPIARNWVTSAEPMNTPLRTSAKDVPRFSAGHVKHEWTSHSCIDGFFKFLQERYEDFSRETSNKDTFDL